MSRDAILEADHRQAGPPAQGSFSDEETEGLPDPVRRYFHVSIAQGTPLARSARFDMRGSVKLGRRWIPFRAEETFAPLHGYLWRARVGGILVGSDRYADGKGEMAWMLLGLVWVIHAEGSDVSRSSVGRLGAEAVWLPTALLPRYGVTWRAADPHHVTANYRLHETDVELECTLDDEARPRAVAIDRWGRPDNTEIHGLYRFEHELTRYSSFEGLTIPSAGRAAWFYGGEGSSGHDFFRYELSRFRLVT